MVTVQSQPQKPAFFQYGVSAKENVAKYIVVCYILYID